ncbi:CGGC domain-containing protein [Halanaerobacter jeridensis]|uniref:Metal-binding protein n=1 Tax=Halanaerobacter jeridensis TaxID=706427 RepID=A0A938XTM2_9FIRM|nr:CGGC domain-containing protein [Halanaerobacter jeridensis]MBM7557313.1 putative metal-binding protein [Halanaerobacter jeridensis]
MKVALIRCLETEGECGGRHCFQTIENNEGAFKEIEEEIELVGVTTCGGCPGDNVEKKVKLMVESNVDAVILGSCIKLGTPIDYTCPNFEKIKQQIKAVDEDIKIIDWTHYETFKEVLVDRIKTTNLNNIDRFFTKGFKL